MNLWQRWLRRPKTVWFRKVCFQVHLWIGLGIGLYIVVLSLTGSILVFRRELDWAFGPKIPPTDDTIRVLTKAELTDAASRAYPSYRVVNVTDVSARAPIVEVSFEGEGEAIARVFNAYNGEDLGDPYPPAARALMWLVRLHDELLIRERSQGLFWNGIGSVLVMVLALAGAILWWPGVNGWRRAISLKWRSAWPRFNYDVHHALGFWSFAMLVLWAVSGIYMAFPEAFTAVVDWLEPPREDFSLRAGDVALQWLTRLHFGRWRSHTLQIVWAVIGLVPAILFVTGVAMWWKRLARKSASAVARRAVMQTAVSE